jgi:hypothetical protein
LAAAFMPRKEREMFATLFERFGGTISVAAVVAVCVAGALLPSAARGDDRDGVCTTASLRGNYGILVSGVRGTPFGPESFVGTALHSYDGAGNFTGFDNTQGEITRSENRPVAGRYDVNPDCTGTTQMTVPPGVDIFTQFVIVDHGREIDETVTLPKGNRVTAVQHRVR